MSGEQPTGSEQRAGIGLEVSRGERHVRAECELECVRVGCWGFQCSCPGHHGLRQSPHEHGRWYVNERHHRAILDGAQRLIDRLGIEGTSDNGDHQAELLGALDLIIVLRLELAAQVRALPDQKTVERAIHAAVYQDDYDDPDVYDPDGQYHRDTKRRADAVLALFGQEGQR